MSVSTHAYPIPTRKRYPFPPVYIHSQRKGPLDPRGSSLRPD
jgi:hypothetical protein